MKRHKTNNRSPDPTPRKLASETVTETWPVCGVDPGALDSVALDSVALDSVALDSVGAVDTEGAKVDTAEGVPPPSSQGQRQKHC
jgi:hypothetical protein